MHKNFDKYYMEIKVRLLRILSFYFFKPFYHIYYRCIYKSYRNPNGDIYINPNEVVGWYRQTAREISFVGQIKGGDWSNYTIAKEEKLAKSQKYNGIVERFVEKKPWIETILFQERYSKMPPYKKLRLGAKNIEELSIKYEKRYNSIYNSLKTEGFLPANKEIGPVFICIDKDGKFYYTDEGNHRLYLAMVLKLNSIPVKVLKRHTIWQEYKDRLFSQYIKGEINDDYIKSLNHHDLLNLIKY